MVANDGMFGHPFKIKPTAYDVLCVPTSNFAS